MSKHKIKSVQNEYGEVFEVGEAIAPKGASDIATILSFGHISNIEIRAYTTKGYLNVSNLVKKEEYFARKIIPGRWWVIEGVFRWVLYVTNIMDDKLSFYGFDEKGQWVDNFFYLNALKSVHPANSGEVRSLLESEKLARGLVPGAEVQCLDDGIIYTISNNRHKDPVGITSSRLWMLSSEGCGIVVMQGGKWAEVRPIRKGLRA